VSGARHRQKGSRIERELVERHKNISVHAERYPLSGASRFRDSGHDIDIYPFGRDAAPFVAEVKARKNGSGFAQLEKWLGEYQVLFLRRDRADPLVLLPWSTWEALLEKVRR
jgi:hypothetical protein